MPQRQSACGGDSSSAAPATTACEAGLVVGPSPTCVSLPDRCGLMPLSCREARMCCCLSWTKGSARCDQRWMLGAAAGDQIPTLSRSLAPSDIIDCTVGESRSTRFTKMACQTCSGSHVRSWRGICPAGIHCIILYSCTLVRGAAARAHYVTESQGGLQHAPPARDKEHQGVQRLPCD